MGRHWQSHALACAVIVIAGCARSRLGIDDLPPGFGAPNTTDGGAGVGSGFGPNTGVAGALPGSTVPPGGGAPATTAGLGGSATAGVNGGSTPPGTGTAGRGNPPPDSPDVPPPGSVPGGNAINPRGCRTEQPFVLSVDPGGTSGHVRGWLESAPYVVFDEGGLPRFEFASGPTDDTNAELSVWWSVASLPGDGVPGQVYFYATNAATEVAHVAHRDISTIGDASALQYVPGNVGPVDVGHIAVFHHIPTHRYLAVRALELRGAIVTDRDQAHLCAALDARWMFAPLGTGTFTDVR